MNTARLGNRPPVKELLADRLSDLTALLRDQGADLAERAHELIEDADRFPDVIGNDELAGRVSDLVKDISACVKNAEAARVADKEPMLQGGRLVDGFYKPITDELSKAKEGATKKLTIWQRKKADEERRAREEAERLAREAAEQARLEAERRAETARDDAELQRAIAAEEAAEQARKNAEQARRDADANAAELSRTRSQSGAVASLRTFWDFEVQDITKVPLETLRPYFAIADVQKAIRGFVKVHQDTAPLAGVRIFENTSTVVR